MENGFRMEETMTRGQGLVGATSLAHGYRNGPSCHGWNYFSLFGSNSNKTFSSSKIQFAFLPDFTEHPKPKRRPRQQPSRNDTDLMDLPPPKPPSPPDDETEITFFHDFVAGGVAGCASVAVGHPFDTYVIFGAILRTSCSTYCECSTPHILFFL